MIESLYLINYKNYASDFNLAAVFYRKNTNLLLHLITQEKSVWIPNQLGSRN